MIEVVAQQFAKAMSVALVKDLLEGYNTQLSMLATNAWIMGASHLPTRRVIAARTDQSASVGELRLVTTTPTLPCFCVDP
ncbi:hypothetical protein [Novosphingobium sp. SG707]|uniref:hypothetical protein n=1 Tax=Novosphingobium sp. SG707 TaxID=2586996 RepID=UPI001445B500|nr:hypothetical protein [Novosphingobium sp. SG707]NKJ00399.1 hypothetical protein [Novosphingobium sp. SG707]